MGIYTVSLYPLSFTHNVMYTYITKKYINKKKTTHQTNKWKEHYNKSPLPLNHRHVLEVWVGDDGVDGESVKFVGEGGAPAHDHLWGTHHFTAEGTRRGRDADYGQVTERKRGKYET